jgi:hypothetical protein
MLNPYAMGEPPVIFEVLLHLMEATLVIGILVVTLVIRKKYKNESKRIPKRKP